MAPHLGTDGLFGSGSGFPLTSSLDLRAELEMEMDFQSSFKGPPSHNVERALVLVSSGYSQLPQETGEAGHCEWSGVRQGGGRGDTELGLACGHPQAMQMAPSPGIQGAPFWETLSTSKMKTGSLSSS